MSRKIYDISPIVSESTAVFPGDTTYSYKELLSYSAGNHLDLCTINTTTHIGAHTDAPRHYNPKGKGMSEVSLERYIGSCQVVEVKLTSKSRIQVSDLKTDITAERILFKTNSFPNPNKWNDDFCALSAELVQFLADKGVKLVGIDTPSIDLSDSKELPAHKTVAKNDMSILEGIVLADIKEGLYELICLPLKLKDADASPVRAVLRSL